ncbi:deoxycytidine triphosphate deaminase [Mesorhizobium sp. M0910]|uniref:dCTP deaminase domain-containing protein n=1 Tax=Mesorhizobium sp. M0910 TaxID=2957025 RepID=UPI00333A8EC0
MFWGNKELEQRLPDLIKPFDSDLLDRATYRLRVGEEVYVSPTGVGSDTTLKTKTRLSSGDDFQIPAGQFTLLITHEEVFIPENALAFISIRAKYKFKGLVNVSGFHVDPGFRGKLIFSVFNAGPRAVHLEHGEACFHIWYADLRDYKEVGDKPGYQNIPPDLVSYIADGVQSFSGLDSKIKDTDKRLADRMASIEKEHVLLKTTAAILGTLLVAIFLKDCSASQLKAGIPATPSISAPPVPKPATPAAQPATP